VSVANVQGGRGGGGGGQQGQAGITGVTTTNLTRNVQALVRDFFVACGVNLATGGAVPTQLFYNDRKGLLWVRASQIDLDIIESAIEILNVTPPQVMIEARLAEMTQNDSKALGFDWYLGNTLSFDGRIGAQGGTAPSYQGRPSAANPNGVFPGPTVVAPNGAIFPTVATIFPRVTDSSLTGSDVISGTLRQSAGIGGSQGFIPEVATITGILTDPQFRTVIRAMEQRDGTDLLAVPRVVTLSGRQTQVQVSEIRTIVTGVQTRQNAGGGGGGQQNQNNAAGGAVASTIQYDTQPIPTGPILDVIPYVCADGYTVQMTLIPSITEFVGYDDPGPFNPSVQSVGAQTVGVPLTAQLPLPRFRIRQVTTTCAVWDGQTVALGGLISEDVRNVKDKVPMLGDLPFLGRLFRSESKAMSKRNMVIFVTPTIIDAAGNRVNSDEDLPFIKTSTPPQPQPKAK
jgi:general secretion pathway protein D